MAVSDIVNMALMVAVVIAGFFFIKQLNLFLNTLVNSAFYLSLVAVGVFGGLIVLVMARQGKISFKQGLASIFFLTLVVIGTPVAGVKVAGLLTSYKVPITVTASQPLLGGEVTFERVSVGEVQEAGPQLFTGSPACLYGCGSWEVRVTVTCGEKFTAIETFTGKGTQSIKKYVEGLPEESQCKVVGDMVRPENHLGPDKITAYFSTGVTG